MCLCSYGMDLLFQAETKIPFHLFPFTQMVFCNVRNKESFCIRNHKLPFMMPAKEGNGVSLSKSQKRHDSTDTTGSLHRYHSVTAWGKWNLFVLVAWCTTSFQIRGSSNSVYQTFHLSSVLTETQLPWGEWEQTRVSDSSANLPLEEGNLSHYLKVFYSLGVKAFIPQFQFLLTGLVRADSVACWTALWFF